MHSVTKLPLIHAVALRLPRHHIRKACRCRAVRYIGKDRVMRAALNVATPTVGGAAAAQSGWTGKGVTIAVLDTGIYPHPDLTKPKNRIAAFRDFVNGRTKPYDDNGHGTHCAGDAAGNGYSSNGKYRGPAKDATLVGIKVLDSRGNGLTSTVIRGIGWCVANRRRYGIRVLSLSLGSPATAPPSRDPLCRAIRAAVRRGLVVVAAAGNSGPGGGTIQTPGISPEAITVGASNDRGTSNVRDDTVALFSSRGPARGGGVKPDLLAPGVNITSLRAPGSLLDRVLPTARRGRWYFTLTGSSMSTPITAGAAAQLLQKNRSLTPGQVKLLLQRHAASLGRAADIQGSGSVNVRFLASSSRTRSRAVRERILQMRSAVIRKK
ncbi:S8 family peptidase [Paenibacillus hamazuiensis]|uniref:S8 family peptidase n=1 Tax=Paenibacillus hamazuiensis TaxID=2936508 RepID=UPI00200FF7B0|nr:S8 family peptidase [Paenibacillus hamazuiensis]